MLHEVGFVGSGAKPTEPVTLYRGVGSPRYRRGLSWTTDHSVALSFARRSQNRGSDMGLVYEARDVAPSAVLAIFLDDRKEQEYVVEPTLLPRLRRNTVV